LRSVKLRPPAPEENVGREPPRLLPVKLRTLGEWLPLRVPPGDPPEKLGRPAPEPPPEKLPPEKLRTPGLEPPDRPPSADEEKPRILGAEPRDDEGPAEKLRLPPEKLRPPPEEM
jgi:hypothetical protein